MHGDAIDAARRPPYPRETMATRMPQAARCVESQATSGVLPVPPTVRLPTTITGTPTRTRWRSPSRYSTLRIAIRTPYKNENGASQTGPAPPYHMRSMLRTRHPGALNCGTPRA